MDMFDLVIFDCDGVVADSESLACACLRDHLGRYGVAVSLDEVFDKFLGRSFVAVAEHYRRVTGKSMPEAFRAGYQDRLKALLAASLKAMPQIEEVLSSLDRSYCLASSSDMERIALTLSVTGLDRYFGERIFNAGMVAHGKPAPDLFLYAASRMGKAPERSLVIEDTVPGIKAAKAARMTAWGFTGGSHYRGRDAGRLLAEAGADRVFGSMAEFTPNAEARADDGRPKT
jgi:HAD superfamily hydrolase (TIGR01509 family)